MGLGVVLVAVTLAQNPDPVRAQAAFEGLKYAGAARALEAAWAAPGNDRETVLEVLKLQAIVAAATGQVDRARTLFRTPLYLAPEFVLPEGDLGPKVMTLFYEAKGRVAVNGVLQLVARPPVRDGGRRDRARRERSGGGELLRRGSKVAGRALSALRRADLLRGREVHQLQRLRRCLP